MSKYILGDCMDYLPEMADNSIDLAIVDPPYGIGYSRRKNKTALSKVQYTPKDWDNETPSPEYWRELFRVSENQIVFGGNYFNLPASRGFIVWDKCQPEGVDQAMCELLWMSIDVSAKIVRECVQQMQNYRIHPTQKPVALYRWILNNYAKPGMRLLDTHVGSASSLIAFEEQGFEYVAFEKDADYYRDSTERIANWRKQGNLFTPQEIRETMIQGELDL